MIKLSKLSLLIVDDNKNYLDNMVTSLSALFATVYSAATFQEALQLIEEKPHIALLDIELDEESGIELAKKFETLSPKSAIIFVSGFSEKEYLLSAIKLNIVDYVIKPATFPLLMESFNKALCRLGDDIFTPVPIGEELLFHPSTETLYKGNREVALGAKERRLLVMLVDNIGRVVKREAIADAIWPHSYMSESALKNLLLELRKKIGKDAITNIPGAGWTLKTE